MYQVEIEHLFSIPDSHPYVSVAAIDPFDYERFVDSVEGRPELKILGKQDKQPDTWKIYVGCASKRSQQNFDDWVNNVF
jgi:hypothetical protein